MQESDSALYRHTESCLMKFRHAGIQKCLGPLANYLDFCTARARYTRTQRCLDKLLGFLHSEIRLYKNPEAPWQATWILAWGDLAMQEAKGTLRSYLDSCATKFRYARIQRRHRKLLLFLHSELSLCRNPHMERLLGFLHIEIS